jgi:hypothetical protein
MEAVLSRYEQLSPHPTSFTNGVSQVIGNKRPSVQAWYGFATVLGLEIWNKGLLGRFFKGDDLEAKINIQRPLCSDQVCTKRNFGTTERA